MKTLWKRCRVSLGTSFETLVNRVENHEAVVAEAIREAQSAAAKARVKLTHVRRDTTNMRRRIDELANAKSDWERRAKQYGDGDRERALECLRRRNRAAQELTHLLGEATRHEQTERNLAKDISKLDEHIATLKRRKNALAARDFRAKALVAGEQAEGSAMAGLDEIFDRWELKLAESECLTESARDSFEDSFIAEEENLGLEAELDDLLKAESTESK
ncbi:PspA/IM30 family protein [Rubellicoccus peritrichatus]|uniref:PspA/IM30 family protein n=1 Tax=Rubellicoccus peritrichatus TaxID=3080537 RepID=A0AAQ3L6X7_9BACT|nr:PspA/IM30 family protein [Puniceicoccus sp. CR14]WOO40181.1 PspA/IM30 family protein [Puniceicoccus sp. CR14]